MLILSVMSKLSMFSFGFASSISFRRRDSLPGVDFSRTGGRKNCVRMTGCVYEVFVNSYRELMTD